FRTRMTTLRLAQGPHRTGSPSPTPGSLSPPPGSPSPPPGSLSPPPGSPSPPPGSLSLSKRRDSVVRRNFPQHLRVIGAVLAVDAGMALLAHVRLGVSALHRRQLRAPRARHAHDVLPLLTHRR